MNNSCLLLLRSSLSRSPEHHLPMRVVVIRTKPPEDETATITYAWTEPAQDSSEQFGELKLERSSWNCCSVVALASILPISRRWSSAERCTRDLSKRSVTLREHSGSPSAVMAFNTSGARFSRRKTCVTLVREIPCFRANSAWEPCSLLFSACCHSAARMTGLRYSRGTRLAFEPRGFPS